METIFSKDRTGNNYIAFFDLDRTITKAVSGKALARGAFKKGLISRTTLAHAIYLSLVYKLKLKDPLKIIDYMVTWVEGISEKTMIDLCSEVFHEVLLPSVYAEARSEIKTHKEKNAKVVILSSAPGPICQEMAKTLGMDDIICSYLEVKNGYLTGRSLGRLCFGEEKMLRLREYCEKNNTESSDAWYYGDSISDIQALSSVGNPVCVNPDKKLIKAAIRRGWKILRWH
ncbi:MAG: HAD-IB family hydrolase [Bacteroidia bacterium]|nr:HAD-IB family hydrolase [Bacteroidia bacterium]